MIPKQLLSGVLFAGFALLSGALAHHAPTSYHRDQVGEIEGEVTRVLWRNPHMRFTVRTDEGVEWQVETSPVTRLARWGLSQEEILPLGSRVRVAGLPPRDDTPQMFGKNLLLPDATHMGIALVQNPTSEYKTFWTLVLGKPL